MMHRQVKDLTGQTFGAYKVLSYCDRANDGHARWNVECIVCKTKHIKQSNNLKAFKKRIYPNKCVCINPRFSHGQALAFNRTKTYMIWASMLQRCSNPKNGAWKYYGGRGIKVCKRWHKFENFFSDMGEVKPPLSIDRINNNGNYEPGNCRWATKKEQRANQGRNKPT